MKAVSLCVFACTFFAITNFCVSGELFDIESILENVPEEGKF